MAILLQPVPCMSMHALFFKDLCLMTLQMLPFRPHMACL